MPAGRSGGGCPPCSASRLIGFAITVGFGLMRSGSLGLVIPAACAGVFACQMARVWGQNPMQVGNLLVVVLVLSLDEPATFHEALERGGLFAAGCLWATLLTMVIWRIYPFRPVRRAVSDAYRSIARLAADLRGLVDGDAAPDAWEAHARGHRRAVRDTVERARTAVQDTLARPRPGQPAGFPGPDPDRGRGPAVRRLDRPVGSAGIRPRPVAAPGRERHAWNGCGR